LFGAWRQDFLKDQIASIRVVAAQSDSGSRQNELPLIVIRTILPAAKQRPSLTFHVYEPGPTSTVYLYRKSKGQIYSRFAVIAERTGPGAISDDGPLADGVYHYTTQYTLPDGTLSKMPQMAIRRVGPPTRRLSVSGLSKPEMEWIATMLRATLDVSDSDSPMHDSPCKA
jgi:hypothetical protein